MGCVKSQVETKTKVKLIEPPTPNDIKKSRRTRSKNIFNSINSSSITEHYEILKVIGSGNVGTLYFAKHLQSEEFRTLREINKIILKDEAAMLSQEVNILKELDHPNILKIYETIETARSLYISLEYISGPSLLERVKTTGCETMLAITMSEVFSALNYLHAKGFVHCNINPEYIVQTGVGYDTVNKLIGFTVAQKIEDKLDINLKKIKYQYASPELLKGDYDEKTDIWSCGILLYELLVGRLPFPSKTKAGIVECIINGDLDFINSMFTSLSKGSQDLIKSMLQIDPSLRPAAQEILLNPMFTASKGKINLSLDAIKKLRSFKIKARPVRSILTLLNFKLVKEDHEIINYFKEIDENFDGKVSKEELIGAFQVLGIDILGEVDEIMQNMDIDGSGFIDYSELKITLTDWSNELKEKNFNKVFKIVDGKMPIDAMRVELIDIKQKDWTDFLKECVNDGEYINPTDLKNYLKANIVQ